MFCVLFERSEGYSRIVTRFSFLIFAVAVQVSLVFGSVYALQYNINSHIYLI